MLKRARTPMLLVAALCAAGCARFCGIEPPPEQQVPTVKGPDAREYILLARGAYKPFWDSAGHLERVEYDRNGDGKPDQIARHNGRRIPEVIENDDDFDGLPDHWLYYDAAGRLQRIGSSRRGRKTPDLWLYLGPDGKPIKQEYDDDGDGRPDRTENLRNGLVDTIEIDADRNGKPDRWQHWGVHGLEYEDIDTDGDGKPDKRLRYGPRGDVVKLENLAK